MERKQYDINKKYEVLKVSKFGNGGHILCYKQLVNRDVLVIYDEEQINNIKKRGLK